MKHRNKGYALLITIMVTLFITGLAITAFTFVYRYDSVIEREKIELRERVK